MDAQLRANFNRVWTPEVSRRVREDLKRRLGCEIPFPVAETPLFLSGEIRERFTRTAYEIMELLCNRKWLRSQKRTVPAAYRRGKWGELPQVAQIDFAVVRDQRGRLVPRLVELQGFPSLYGFQIQLADVWAAQLATMPGLPQRWRLFFSGQDRAHALALLRQTILGDHGPEEVILLDIEPEHQKTWPDFAVTQRWFGVDPICVKQLKREGNRLYRVKDGKKIAIRRIYQRIVFDELEQMKLSAQILFHENVDVEWAPHPAWFFLWSKQSLLTLDHPAVPKTIRLSELEEVPADLSRFVLKPLYSFAGAGVNVEPTRADVEAVPEEDRAKWVLQEKVDYCEAFRSAEGDGVKAEVRMMFVRPDGWEKMMLLLNLVRLSRGKMMGVDYNKDLSWTGSSVGIWCE